MKKINFLIVIALFIILGACTSGAHKSYTKGKKKFDQGEYQFAIEQFQEALKKGYKSSEPNYYIAESYRRSNRISEAESFYKAAIDGNTKEEEAYYYYGIALKSKGNYASAEDQLKDYVKIGKNFDLINRAKNEIDNLKVLNEIVAKKSYYKLENLEKLNTPNAEFSPFFYKDKLLFTTSRGAEKTYGATGTGFTDIYEYLFDGVEKFSGQARVLPKQINSEDAHEASAVLSNDGKMMVFSRGNNGSKKGRQDVDLYSSIMENGEWAEPVLLPFNDPIAWDASPCFSADGKTLYFSSNRDSPEAKGGSDIYTVDLNAQGEWGVPKNLGAPVNTRGYEMYPYENSKKEFFFASDGHPSFGKLDLFAVKTINGKTIIENLGQPLNSSYDDFALVYKDSTVGYLSSDRPDGKGDDDIYEFTDFSKIRIAHYILDGTAFGQDKKSKSLLEGATIKIINEKGDTIGIVSSKNDGKFNFEIEPETEYKIRASKQGYLTEEYHLSTAGQKVAYKDLKPGENDIKIPMTVILPVKEVGVTIIIDNIYYDFNKWDIRPDAAIELFKIVELLVNNPDIKIELSANTDERGSADYNRKLSQKRAQSAVNFIISKGIAKDRIIAKGYGEDRPLVPGATTEEDHQRNRRTEFTITNVTNPNIKIKKKDDGSDQTIKIKMKDQTK